MDEWTTRKLKGWSYLLFNGISRYFEANFDFLLLCYFFAGSFCLRYFTLFQLWVGVVDAKYEIAKCKPCSLLFQIGPDW